MALSAGAYTAPRPRVISKQMSVVVAGYSSVGLRQPAVNLEIMVATHNSFED